MRYSWALLLLVLVASGPGASAQSPPPVAPVVTPPPFDEWLIALKAEAIERGIASELVERAFTGLQPVEQILERDRTQAEFALDLEAYLKRRLTPPTIRVAVRCSAMNCSAPYRLSIAVTSRSSD